MKIGIVGGGINGLCCAWVLSQKGHDVDLYEKNKLLGKTSCSSSKLLHGGLRYLEQGDLRLVREALKERDAWLKRAPDITQPIRLILPIYKSSRRKRWVVKAGLFLYDNLAGVGSSLPKSKWLSAKELKCRNPDLLSDDLVGGYEFSDGQMDDYKLGLWVAEQARHAGSKLIEDTEVRSIDEKGNIYLEGSNCQYDMVINVSGPWAAQLLESSNIQPSYQLDAVRGSHLVLDKPCVQSYLFEVPNEKRIFFVLPWKGNTLVGTTEVRQTLDEPIECSQEEKDYLITAYNWYHLNKVTEENVLESFAGIRPLLSSKESPENVTREYAIQRTGRLINVFGGKWTTALALANKVLNKIDIN